MPPDTDGGIQAQILVELGKLSTAVAVLDTKMGDVADHETRIRGLEARPSLRWPLIIGFITAIIPVYALVIELIVRR